MLLSGELTDLSFAELIEFFCNHRKTGRLEIVCPRGCGDFYLCAGSIVHAQIGTLLGVEAVHYALTLRDASFTFSGAIDAPERTIDQPWASVVLEGLRRLDEGINPPNAFADEEMGKGDAVESQTREIPSFLWQTETRSAGRWKLAVVVAAVVLIVLGLSAPKVWNAQSSKGGATTTNAEDNGREPANDSLPRPIGFVSASWYSGANEYAKAEDEHLRARAPLLIYFRTDWCPYCKKLEEEILPSNEVSEFAKSVVKIRINPEAGPEERALADRFGVKGYPSIFVVSANSDKPVKIFPFRKAGETFIAATPQEFVSECRVASFNQN